ncbi:hypothetical protein QYF61_014344 [Mycteria americana]|uniref:Uncharacterized protein n=1 Tax=Mycteria americana TaxID=33587 RepID=A0AAN7RTB4_MYCAM|nr:hypothetical protein QYF61_014344 [Mycteria americana]
MEMRETSGGIKQVKRELTSMPIHKCVQFRSMDVGRSVDVTYLDLGKTFNKISHSILIVTTGWLKKLSEPSGSRIKFLASIMGLFMFNIFINDLEEEVEYAFTKLADNTIELVESPSLDVFKTWLEEGLSTLPVGYRAGFCEKLLEASPMCNRANVSRL